MKQMQQTLGLVVTLFFSSFLFGFQPSDEGQYKGLVIAVDQYSSDFWKDNKNAVNDAKSLQELLLSKYQFSSVQMLFDADATRINIIDRLDKFIDNTKPEDKLVIFFSGHGVEKGKEGFWVPVDAKTDERFDLVSNSDVKSIIGKSKSKSILLISDACFSGSSFKSSNFYFKNDGSDDYYKKLETLASRQALISGSKSTIYDEGSGHSVFMKYTLKFLEKNTKPIIEANEIYEFLKYPVFANTPNMPRFGHIQDTGHEGGQFLLKTKDAVDEVEKPVIQADKVENNPKSKVEKDDIAKEDDAKVKSEKPVTKSEKPVTKGEKTSIKSEKKTIVNAEDCKISALIKEGRAIVFKNLESELHAVTDAEDAKFQWFFNDEPMGETKSSVIAKKDGIYRVVVYTSSDCKKEISAFVKIELPAADAFIQEGSNPEFTMKGELTGVINVPYSRVEWRSNGLLVGRELKLKVYHTGVYTIHFYRDGNKVAETSTNVLVNPRIYRTKLGDNVESISKKFYGDAKLVNLIYDANKGKVKEGKPLKVGTILVVPLQEAALEIIDNNDGSISSLKLAAVNGLRPFSTKDIYKDGMITDLVQEAFSIVGQPVEVDFKDLSSVRGATFNGEYAAAFPFPKNKRDERVMLYSEPIYQVYNVFFSKKGADIKFTSPKRLRGKKVGVVVGYNIDEIEEYYRKKYIKLKPCRTLEEAFLLLKKGEIDLVATSQIAGYGIIRSNVKLNNDDFEVLSKSISSSTLHLVVSKTHPIGQDIINAFNSAYKELNQSGKAGKIIDDHLDRFQTIKP